MKTKLTLFVAALAAVFFAGCSSMKSRNVQNQGGPYPGVRNLSENYSEADWGVARVPAMIIDLPFSAAADTLALPFDAVK
jgi:uncharacterized protein YceK|tara:strand:- start:687 stop:926 length:240 start_codon:yes stop_codon:yes gene_type:complete